MKNNAEFEQFINFLAEMIEKYGREVLKEIKEEEQKIFLNAWMILPILREKIKTTKLRLKT